MSIVTHQDRACIVACFISSIVVREPSDQKAKDKQPSSVHFAAVAAPLFFFLRNGCRTHMPLLLVALAICFCMNWTRTTSCECVFLGKGKCITKK
jgi:hypothetical protein